MIKRTLIKLLHFFIQKNAASTNVSTINHVLKFEFEDGDKIEQIIINEIDQGELEKMTNGIPSVSYTHLTLPTILLV